jgi:HEAT repeat protein
MPDRTDVLRILESEEPDYPKAASTLGPEVLPELERFARGADPLLASKATYLASMIDSPQSRRVVEAAARREEPEVRVAAAAAVANLAAGSSDSAALADEAGGGVLDRLLQDPDPGVRKFALKSASSMNLQDRLQSAANSDPAEFVRETARDGIDKRPSPE